MQPYYIQYPSIYPSYISQRSINNNLVEKYLNCSKEGEKDVKKGLSDTQKRRLQCLRKQESMEQKLEVEPTKSIATKEVWRPKQIVSSST